MKSILGTSEDVTQASLTEKYREMARDAQHEGEADAWSEGLIGDAFVDD
jgi:hypothetical protein